MASCDIGAVGWEFGDWVDGSGWIEASDGVGCEVGGWIVDESNVRQANLAEVTDRSFDGHLYDATGAGAGESRTWSNAVLHPLLGFGPLKIRTLSLTR